MLSTLIVVVFSLALLSCPSAFILLWLTFKNRARLPPPYDGFLPAVFCVMLALGTLSLSNDVFHYGRLLHGPDLPFSPIFVLLMNCITLDRLRQRAALAEVEVRG